MKFEEPKSGEGEAREMQWRAVAESIGGIKDRLGKGIDEEIKPAVIGLKANGFGTTMSCEGHLDWALPWPWVVVESQLAERHLSDRHFNELKGKVKAFRNGEGVMSDAEKQEYEELTDAQIEENEKEFQRLTGFLQEFYKPDTEESHKGVVRLGINKGPWNQSRLQPADVPTKIKPQESQKLWPEQEKEQRLLAYRKEMERFSDFLKQKFFEQSK